MTVVEAGEFQSVVEVSHNGHVQTHRLLHNNAPMPYRDVLDRWAADDAFVDFHCSLLRDCEFASHVWEVPPVTKDTLDRLFEFVMVSTPRFAVAPDHRTFADFFDPAGGDHGVVAFDNLGRDALLVVPSPGAPDIDFSSLAAFLANAPLQQQRALWRVVAQSVRQRLDDRPLWLSVAGGGVAWLHVRLDERPKYYRHAPYRMAP